MDIKDQTTPNIQEPIVEKNNQVPSSDDSHPRRKGVSLPVGIILLVVSFIGGILLAGLYFQAQLQKVKSNNLAVTPKIAKVKQLVVGTDATLPPMEYSEAGKDIGYDIDLSNALAQELNTDVVFKNIVFDDLFTALEQKKIDMIISAVTITDDRKKKYDFSDPYLNAGQVIITKKDNTTIKTTADLQGKKIAVQSGTTNEKEALLHTSPNLVIRYPDFVQATKALVNGQVDAVFNDLPGAKGTITDNPTLKIASDPFTNEYYGIVFRKGDPNIKQINEALAAIRIKGILTDLKQKWLD